MGCPHPSVASGEVTTREQGKLDSLHEFRWVKGFGKNLFDVEFRVVARFLHGKGTGHDKDWKFETCRANPLDQFQPVEPRHLVIRHERIKRLPTKLFPGLFAVNHSAHSETTSQEQSGNNTADGRIILSDQYSPRMLLPTSFNGILNARIIAHWRGSGIFYVHGEDRVSCGAFEVLPGGLQPSPRRGMGPG
jgi:hypothetical protein